jgi:uncharacterized protein with von Willebrand factor type A (vWA) domain
MTRAEDLRAIRKHYPWLAHELQRREWKSVRKLFPRAHNDETVRLMREVLDATERHTRGSPVALVDQLYSILNNRHYTPEAIARTLPTAIAMAKGGKYPGYLLEVLSEGLSARALPVDKLHGHAALLRQVVEKVGGSLRFYGMRGFLLHGIGRELITRENLERAFALYAKHLEAVAVARHPPEKFEEALARGARSLKDLDEIDKLAAHAHLAWQTGRGWSPAELFTHALEANEQIKDLDETLKLQREMLAKGIFPTKTLTLRYWKARPK